MAYLGIFLIGIFLPISLVYIFLSKKEKEIKFKEKWGFLYEFQKVNSLT